MFVKETKRTSFDLSINNSEILKHYASASEKNLSQIINATIQITMGAAPEVRRAISGFCSSKILEIEQEISCMSDFQKQEAMQLKKQYQDLAHYFSVGLEPEKENENQRKIYLQDGYVLIPNSPDWIVLDNYSNPANYLYAGVVETREPVNGKKQYDPKHYVFFTNYKYGRDYPETLEDEIYAACCAKDPSFKQILNNVVTPQYKDQKHTFQNMINLEAYKAAPCPGLFHIIEQDDLMEMRSYQPDYQPPYGCMIVRK